MKNDVTHPLRQARPAFLDALGSDPDRAFEEFYVFATKLFGLWPPGPLRGLQPADQEDVIQSLIYHCCRNDFAVLKRYENRGAPFSAWLLRVLRNQVIDFCRRQKPDVPLSAPDDDAPPDRADPELPDPIGGLDRAAALTLVRDCLQRLDRACRALIRNAADGLKPRELARVMGLGPDRNKEVSDRLRYCRKKLREQVQRRGLDLTQILPPSR